MKIRMHRGSLADSMATSADIAPDLPAVRAYLAERGIPDAATAVVEVKPYGYDERIDWDMHMVTVDGYPMAWTDGPLHAYPESGSSKPGEAPAVSEVKPG